MKKQPFIVATERPSPFSFQFSYGFNMGLGMIPMRRFADSETYINSNIALPSHTKHIVFVFQFFAGRRPETVGDRFAQLLCAIDFCKILGVSSVTLLLPYFCYARQDTSFCGSLPGPLGVLSRCLKEAGVDRILTTDIHSSAAVKACELPLFNMDVTDVWAEEIEKRFADGKKLDPSVWSVVSPDKGGVARAELLAKRLAVPIVKITKKRTEPDTVAIVGFQGDVAGKNVIVIDDIIDTAKTATNIAKVLREKGAQKVIGCFTHAAQFFALDHRLALAGPHLFYLLPLGHVVKGDPKRRDEEQKDDQRGG